MKAPLSNARSVNEPETPLDQINAVDLSILLAQDPRPPQIERICGKLPPAELQARFTGLSAQQTFRQAITYLDACRSIAVSRGQSWGGAKTRVFDFGCGWGRITQLLATKFSPENILAGDVQNEALMVCKGNGVQAVYELLSPWPPSGVPDSSVDFIFAYSVFSHLSEQNADAWVREFHRILRPGGMAFLTTRHRSFFDHLERVHQRANQNTAEYARGAVRAFLDVAAARARYDAGGFCFDPLGGGGPGLTAVYGEAFIPAAWARKTWGKRFATVDYIEPIPAGLLDQATIVLGK